MPLTRDFTDDLKNDPLLQSLTDGQLEAIIDVLALMTYADKALDVLEVAELDPVAHELPWTNRTAGQVAALLKRALDRARQTIHDESGRRAIIEGAARELVEPAVREKVYHLVCTMAWSDSELHGLEVQVLAWLAEAFGIDDDTAGSILARTKSTD